ncbi:MAG: nitrous oxide-stimulated promoter family protein [Caldisericales bacterium]|nr:nitrous oxide-stimulated promoter family protein [Caldisericales bacterium]
MSIECDKQTIGFMVRVYCRGKHKRHDALCHECEQLLDYANKRLSKCPFGDSKTSCKKCKVHCYEKGMREKVRKVMKYAGPRMFLHHPILAILHLFK